ncbi:SusC/RagA family TonB-linked outer membrane protein [Carboxylicivirga sp. M1479]|uniref:SusC/RagA family TonB-linked outer membrane protein n=1 Tax=Carboxylicivirga sp. M1479 TaxID=2594476 RepID=UPI001178176C|nr:SusC/RagA family TonB-linked outer membrane protein [Carboxylicivirga sp. M1479]TRX70988.1 SusC/RagA family TonB-linked outer membrane protein [Carboxylicivirga sp. M1479]
MRRLALIASLILFVGLNAMFAQTTTITGTVTDSEDKEPMPGVSVVVRGTTIGTVTNVDGNYSLSVPDDATNLLFSFVGMKTQDVVIGGRSAINVALISDAIGVDEVVVTALGIKRAQKTLPYAAQQVKAEKLNVTSDANIKNAIVGKVAGVQMVGQAGSKLGDNGRLRIRGAISMTSDGDPLYVIDGIPTSDPNSVDMENVASVNVLKGPNATALYGQRGEYGVVMITTKRAKKGGISVEINSNTTFDKVSYLPNYQNEYGRGYGGESEWSVMDYAAGGWGGPYPEEFAVFDGMKYISNGYADESWGPKFDGSEYVPWYAVWPDSPYYGETAKWEAQPDNIKDFYDTGVTLKNTVSVSGAGDNYTGRIAYTNINQSGIIPNSELKKNMINANFDFDATDKLSVGMNINFTDQIVEGDFDDGYSNQVTGTFNSWFARDVDMGKMKELRDLQTTNGYHASWNWWGFDYASYFGDNEKPAFWYSPYFWLDNYKNKKTTQRLVGDVHAAYKFNDKFELSGSVSTNTMTYERRYELPYAISNSADLDFYNVWNSGFGNYWSRSMENNYNGMFKYTDKFGEFDVELLVGTTHRTNSYKRFNADMETGSKSQDLVLPDVFVYSNTRLPVTASTNFWNKEVTSIYSRFSVGWRNMVYVDGSVRKDWSSALPSDNNGYTYPSIGSSFIFSELITNKSILSFGKFRAGWAQVGNDVSALALNPTYPLSSSPYMGNPQMYTNTRLIDPNIKPSLNTSVEAGVDLKFFNNRAGLSFTYFNEVREDEIIPVELSTSTGYRDFLTNAGKAKRSGIEIVLEGTPVKIENFRWDVTFNYGTSETTIEELPADLQSMAAPGGSDDWDFVTVTHELGNQWGQLRGRGIRKDENGNKVINAETGLYDFETGQYFGSILPDFTGGLLNSFTIYKIVNISAAIDFQKGGNFFSLSEMWGQYSGLLEETAGLNDIGNPQRDAIADGGGVHVVGVDTDGNEFDQYVDAQSYYGQFNSNVIADEYIHDASYVKLRDLSISVNVPQKYLSSTFIRNASVGFVGRNLWMISVSDDNIHGWDPSEMSQSYGENSQLPGTRSYGFNVKLSF